MKLLVEFLCLAVGERLHAVHVPSSDGFLHLVFARSGRRARAARVREDVHAGEVHLLDEVEPLLEVLFRLTGEADDDVRRDGNARHFLLDVLDEACELRRVVMAVHVLEHLVGAGLQRQVEVRAEALVCTDQSEELRRELDGLERAEAQALEPRHGEHLAAGVGQRDAARQVAAVGAEVDARRTISLKPLATSFSASRRTCSGWRDLTGPARTG